MEPATFFQHLVRGLEADFGPARAARNCVRFGMIGIEYECVGRTMIVFLASVNWTQYVSWDGAVHIDMQTNSISEAVAAVKRMMLVARGRTTA